jgi:hypothetical protein
LGHEIDGQRLPIPASCAHLDLGVVGEGARSTAWKYDGGSELALHAERLRGRLVDHSIERQFVDASAMG